MTRPVHTFTVTGVRFPTAACTCGWVSERHRSRGEAYRAWDAHRWYATRTLVRAVFGSYAWRHQSHPAGQERPV